MYKMLAGLHMPIDRATSVYITLEDVVNITNSEFFGDCHEELYHV